MFPYNIFSISLIVIKHWKSLSFFNHFSSATLEPPYMTGLNPEATYLNIWTPELYKINRNLEDIYAAIMCWIVGSGPKSLTSSQ